MNLLRNYPELLIAGILLALLIAAMVERWRGAE